MQLATIIAELEAAAQQEAAGIHVLETTHWEREAPELLAGSLACLAAARRRAEALSEAVRLLRLVAKPQAFVTLPGQGVYLDAPPSSASLWSRLWSWMAGAKSGMAGRAPTACTGREMRPQ